MSRILGEEHDDCVNWARWVKDLELGRGYPKRWLVPDAPSAGLIERDRLLDELEAMEATAYDAVRAWATDQLFRYWLDECRTCGKCWGKRHFLTLHAVYLFHRDVWGGEFTVRKALRALADLKAKNPLAQPVKLSYDGGQGELSPKQTQRAR